MLSKKSQSVQQVFIFMLSVIVIALILLIGYKAVDGLLRKSCDANVAQFRENLFTMLLENQIYGSLKRVELEVPCSGLTYICFVNSSFFEDSQDKEVDVKDLPASMPFKALLKTNIESGSEANVYLIGNKFEELGFVEHLRSSEPILCVSAEKTKSFRLKFVGKGSYVLVDTW